MIGADVGKGSGSERVCIFTWAKYRVMWDGGGETDRLRETYRESERECSGG